MAPNNGGGRWPASWLTGTWFYQMNGEGGQQQNNYNHLKGPGGWQLDSGSAELVYDGCDIDVVPVTSFTRELFMSDYADRKPVLVRGLANEWPAVKDGAWSKEKFLSNSVNISVNVGQSSTIVAAGGGWTGKKSLRDFIHEMDESSSDGDDALRQRDDPKDISFDVKFFYENPELIKDFSNPDIFQQFCNKEGITRGDAWLIFSLGSSRSGLQFHVHGPTWLGVVFGQKRWFLHPPGAGLSSNAAYHEAGWHPLMNMMTFVDSVLSKLGRVAGPLQCTQLPGDVIYLPAGYKHATLNIGETLAAGCQGAYPDSERLPHCKSVLKQFPNDFECLKGYALGLVAEPLRILDGGYRNNNGIDNYKKSHSIAVKQIQQSLPMLFRAIELRPGDPEAYFLVIELLMTIGDIQQAREVVRIAAKQFTKVSLPPDISDQVVYDIHLALAKYMRSLGLDSSNDEAS